MPGSIQVLDYENLSDGDRCSRNLSLERLCPVSQDGPRQARGHMRPVHRSIRFQRHTLSSKLIDNGEDAVGPAVRQLVADEIGRPVLVRRCCNTLRYALPPDDLRPQEREAKERTGTA